jgi:hypothetical protein
MKKMDRTPQFKRLSKFILKKTLCVKVSTPYVEGSYKLKRIRKYEEQYGIRYEFEIEFTGIVCGNSLKGWKEKPWFTIGNKRSINDRIRSAVCKSLHWYLRYFSIEKNYYATSDIKKIIWV